MKKFDKQKALAGDPVMLRNGCKAFVKFEIENPDFSFDVLIGFFINEKGKGELISWSEEGEYIDEENERDIVGMYEEDEIIIINLARPIRAAINGDQYYFVSGRGVESLIFNGALHMHQTMLNSGSLFTTETGAKTWESLKDRVMGG